MVKFCTYTKYIGPVCYEITEKQRTNIQILKVVLLILIVLLFVSFITKQEYRFIAGIMIVTAIIFVWYVTYEYLVTSQSKILCMGYRDCNKENLL
jgi:hypothetical protein